MVELRGWAALVRTHPSALVDLTAAKRRSGYFGERESEVDLIISDVVMPKLSGRELYRRVRQVAGGVKFLFSSGYTASDVEERAAFAAEVPFLHKPRTLTELGGPKPRSYRDRGPKD